MIAFDTNILVRYLTGDDPRQCAKVDKLLEQHRGEATVFISDIVLVELEWVLSSFYRSPRKRIAEVLRSILGTREFCFTDKESLLRSLSRYAVTKGDLSDCLIGEHGKAAGARTYTFDKDCKRDSNFVVI